jgi:hypothetical protein
MKRLTTIKNHFPAGSTTLNGVDLTDDGVISLTETLSDVAREPDAVAWVPAGFGKLGIATANEGDLFGGSRGFSIYRRDGSIAFDSGNALEELAVQHGHYPEGRSANKGTEPEAITYARFGNEDYLFVGTERGSFVAIYKLDRFGRPRFGTRRSFRKARTALPLRGPRCRAWSRFPGGAIPCSRSGTRRTPRATSSASMSPRTWMTMRAGSTL